MGKSVTRFLIFLIILWIGSIMAYYLSNMLFIAIWYAGLFVVSLYFTLKTGERLSDLFRLDGKWLLKSILFLPLIYVLMALVSLIFPNVGATTQVQKVDLTTAILVTFLGPVSEEMAFRGYAQGLVRRKLSVNSTILLTALFFSFFHPLDIFPQIFVMSIVLSIAREISGSLVPPMIIHCLNNTVALVVSFMT